MKWQRARLLALDGWDYNPKYPPGTLVWVRVEAPKLRGGRGSWDDVRIPPMLTYRTPIGPIHQAAVELLPEFSDADDPDAEVRQ